MCATLPAFAPMALRLIMKTGRAVLFIDTIDQLAVLTGMKIGKRFF